MVRRLLGIALAVAVASAAVAIGGTPALSASPAAAPRATACRRDTAADLRWVTGLYRWFVGRVPTAAEYGPRLADLVDGVPYREVADAVALSDAGHRRVALTAFGRFQHRSPSAAELAAWTAWNRDHGPTSTVARIAADDEAWRRAGATPAGWVAGLYQDMVAKPVDAGGSAYWTAKLAAGTSRIDVAAAIWNSPASLRLRVDAAYRTVLGRAADPGGATTWAPVALAHGDTELATRLALTSAGWSSAQVASGGVAGPVPAACPPVGPHWVPSPGTVVHSLQPVARFGPRLVALTFDDGPDPRWTPQILAVLKAKNVRATFFMVGDFARARPDLVRQVAAARQHIASHSMSHPNLLRVSDAEQRRQIVDSADLLDRIAGTGTVRCFRPPYGNKDAATVRIAKERGLATILWSRDGQDWSQPGVDQIVRGNLDTRFDGGRGVVVLHDGGAKRAQTVAALPKVIDALRSQGYTFVQLC
ncbi:MAG: polysaccharide deacetylase family protein [Actinobacteria bacterium]|nr:polysaccharide deacetylase family protein [Actinomycetota bacterium]